MLDFLLENWWVLLLFIGIFFSMLGSDRRKRTAPPPVRPAPTPVDFPWESKMEETTDHVRATKENQREDEERRRRISQEGIRTSKELSRTKSEEEVKADLNLVINKQEVIQGLIWSQILEKPKARNPHPAGRYQK